MPIGSPGEGVDGTTRSAFLADFAEIYIRAPELRFCDCAHRKHPRWEPGARIAPAGICAGGAQQ